MKEVAEKKGAIAIECPAGSVAVWDGSLWHGSGVAQLLGRHDFLGKPEGKSDFQKFYNAIANSRA